MSEVKPKMQYVNLGKSGLKVGALHHIVFPIDDSGP